MRAGALALGWLKAERNNDFLQSRAVALPVI
jgi:hypothetical protein